jgi:hypothetical protein
LQSAGTELQNTKHSSSSNNNNRQKATTSAPERPFTQKETIVWRKSEHSNLIDVAVPLPSTNVELQKTIESQHMAQEQVAVMQQFQFTSYLNSFRRLRIAAHGSTTSLHHLFLNLYLYSA